MSRYKILTYSALGLALLSGGAYISVRNAPSTTLSRHLKDSRLEDLRSPYKRALVFIRQYRKDIVGDKADQIPPEIVGAVIIRESERMRQLDDISDWLQTKKTGQVLEYLWPILRKNPIIYLRPSSCTVDPTLGPGQVRLSTAAKIDAKNGERQKTKEELEALLQDPAINLKYIRDVFSDIAYRKNRLSPESHSSILNDPHLVAVTLTEYFVAPTDTKLIEARPSEDGIKYSMTAASTELREIFGKDARMTERQRAKIQKYVKESKWEVPLIKTKNNRLRSRC